MKQEFAAYKLPEDAQEWSIQRSWTVMPTVALHDKNSRPVIQLAHGLNSRLSLVARPSRQSTLLWKKLTLHIPLSPQYKYIYIHEILRASRENFERETLEENKIDSSIIFTLWLFKFLYSHPFHCYILERFFNQILFSPYQYMWEGFLVLWEVVLKEPIHIGWCYEL